MTIDKGKSYAASSSPRDDDTDHGNVASTSNTSLHNADPSGITRIPKAIGRVPPVATANTPAPKQKNLVFGQICSFFRKSGTILITFYY